VRHGEHEVRSQALHRAPPQQPTLWLWSRKGDLQRAWNRGRKAVWDQVGYHIIGTRDKACLRRGHNDQSWRGHQHSETTLTGESRFHILTPWGIWTRVPCDRKQTGSPLDQWDMVRMKWDCRLSTQPYILQQWKYWYATSTLLENINIQHSYLWDIFSVQIYCFYTVNKNVFLSHRLVQIKKSLYFFISHVVLFVFHERTVDVPCF
jgi:hypothetical protein